jgi:hypothetical protein
MKKAIGILPFVLILLSTTLALPLLGYPWINRTEKCEGGKYSYCAEVDFSLYPEKEVC